MKGVDSMLVLLLVAVGVVAFLNHGSFGLGTGPKGSSVNIGYQGG